MILNDKTKIKVSKKNIEHLKSKGYDVKLKDIIEINTKDINIGSHMNIKVKCDICGKEKEIMFQKYIKNISNGGFYSCSSKCAQDKIKKTNKDKFGKEYYTQTNEYKKKIKNNSLNKYGVEHYLQSDEIKEKIIKTNLEKYGSENPFGSKEIKEKIIKTNLEKYGSENPFGSKEIKEKIIKTNLEKYGVNYPQENENIRNKTKINNYKKYGVEYISQLEEVKKKIKKDNIDKYGKKSHFQLDKNIKRSIESKRINWFNKIKVNYNYNFIDINYENKMIKILCNKNHRYDISFKIFYLRNLINTEICTICNPLNSSKSGLENQLFDFISNNIDVKRNERKILDNKYELDIYIPELKLAFEFNGLYWHNELYKDKNYHLNKTELCEENGIQLIHIYEDDWIYKQDIVKSMILNKLGKTPNKIYARKTEIREITDNKLVREFLDKNHIQGFIGSKVKLGLFYEEDLVSLMTFGKRRVAMGKKTSEEGEFELLRFCSKLNTNVVGGGNKLFKYFIKNYDPRMITTYADRSWSNGNLYKQLGFKYEGKTEPNYYYIIDGIRHHRFNFRKDKLIREGYNSELTEHQIMLNRKIYRIFDSGNLKFKLQI